MSEVTPIKSMTAGQWWVQVGDVVYGPYSLAQLSKFASEGRVRPSTKVSNRRDGNWVEARRIVGLTSPQRGQQAAPAAAANMFIHAEIMSGAWTPFMAALHTMGSLCELAPGFWLLRTRHAAGVIRNALQQTLERSDRFIVVDATRDRLAWFNLGPEVDVRIGSVWNAPLRSAAP